jgi:hypothetical protein
VYVKEKDAEKDTDGKKNGKEGIDKQGQRD